MLPSPPVFAERRQHRRLEHDCPICTERPTEVLFSREEVAAELALREEFFAPRLDEHFAHRSLRDVTDAALGIPAAILQCQRCGVLVREGAPDEELFSEDSYDTAELAFLHHIHTRAFRAKEQDYRALLPAGAHVLEVGAYAGGFMRVAQEWGWRALGTDIGHDTVRFSRSLGLNVQELDLDESALETGSLDGFFVWNCFEQVPDAGVLVAQAERLLRRDGLFVIRIPDAPFYLHWSERRRSEDDGAALAVLAYNGLLGWPHRFGYGVESLRKLVESRAFRFCQSLRRPVIRPLRHAMLEWARQEEATVIDESTSGWIELTFRKGE